MPLNTVEPSPVLVSGRDNTDAEIGLYATLDPALIRQRWGAAKLGTGEHLVLFVAAQLEDLGDRRRGLLSCFLSSREVAAAAAAEVEGMGLG